MAEVRQQRHRPTGGTFVRARLPRGAGDVQMRPAVLAGEAAQEHRGGDRPAGAGADVAHVGEVALQRFVVLLVERHAPARVERIAARGAAFARLDAMASNGALCRYYEERGFRPLETVTLFESVVTVDGGVTPPGAPTESHAF